MHTSLHRRLMTAMETTTSKQVLEETGEAITTSTAHTAEIKALKWTATAPATSFLLAAKVASLAPMLSILVVLLTLLGVVDYLIRLVERLELGFGFGVIGMQVRMELLYPLAVCCLYIFLWDVLVYT